MSSSDRAGVLVVDDSAFMRRVICDMVDRLPGFAVVGRAEDGVEALRLIEALDPDVVTLDIEMPRLDGFGVLEEIMSTTPRPVVVLSGHTASNAALRALELGAVEFVPKPSGPVSFDLASVESRLYRALEAAANADVGALLPPRSRRARGRVATPSRSHDAAVAIAASTGGPRALSRILAALPADLGAAVFVVQHMPVGFTAALARRLNELCALPVSEATGGETARPNECWIAPGGFHMRVRRVDGSTKIVLDQRDPIWGTRPAADALFPSVATAFRSRCVGVVLTGMGRDGAAGLAAMRAVGGQTLAQDRESSVVYGMPGRAMADGAAQRALPLAEIPAAIVECLDALAGVEVEI